MPFLQPGQVAAYAKAAGWPQDRIAWVVAVSFAESTWNTDATHYNPNNGTTDYGLMQDNSAHTEFPDFFPPSDNWRNPLINLTVAKRIFDSQGETAWVSSDNPTRQQVKTIAEQTASQVAGINDRDHLIAYAGGAPNSMPGWVDWIGAHVGAGVTVPDFKKYPGTGFPPSIGNSTVELGTDIAYNGILGALFGDAFKQYGSALWIAGGATLVILGVVLLAKDTDIGKAAIGVASKAAIA